MSTTASYVLDSASYTQVGAFNDDSPEWGETFRILGGESCGITPSWIHGHEVGGMYMEVVGTPEALAFVEQSVAVA